MKMIMKPKIVFIIRKRSQMLCRLQEFTSCPDFFGTKIVVESFSFFDGSSEFLCLPDSDLEAAFSAGEAVYFDSIFDFLLTFRTDHLLCGFFEARDVEVVLTWSDQHRTEEVANVAFTVNILIFVPFDIVLDDFRKL